MAQQGETPFAGQPALEQGQEGVPDKVVEAVVDGDKPDGYKIVRTATGKNYVEVSVLTMRCCRQRSESRGCE
jgi:hypothetical protein